MIPRWLDRAIGSGGILAYHGVGDRGLHPAMHVTPERFREQIEFVRHRYNVVRLEELLSGLQNGDGCEGRVAITFDDAYLGVASLAMPILQRLQLPATIFVSTMAAETGMQYWWDVVELASRDPLGEPWRRIVEKFTSDHGDQNTKDFASNFRDIALREFAGRPGIESIEPDRTSIWRSMTFEELNHLSANDLVDFGVHTVSHPNLTRLPLPIQIAEIRDSHLELKRRLPRVLPYIAYPYGLYDRSTCEAAAAAGMLAGFTMDGMSPARRTSILAIPRLGVAEVHSERSLELRLSAAMRPIVNARRGRWPRWAVSSMHGPQSRGLNE